MAYVLARLMAQSAEEEAFLTGLAEAPLRNWNGIEVGRLQPASSLRAAFADR